MSAVIIRQETMKIFTHDLLLCLHGQRVNELPRAHTSKLHDTPDTQDKGVSSMWSWAGYPAGYRIYPAGYQILKLSVRISGNLIFYV